MKSFASGDVVPGCTAIFRGSEEQILDEVASHARHDHGMTEIPAGLVDQVRSNIR
jgi:predicted small metal-binding protein